LKNRVYHKTLLLYKRKLYYFSSFSGFSGYFLIFNNNNNNNNNNKHMNVETKTAEEVSRY